MKRAHPVLAFSVGAVEKCLCFSWTRGGHPLDTMGHSGARKHDRMCSVEHDASPGEKRRGTMVYMLTTPTYTSSNAQLRFRVCGVGSRREIRVRVRIRSGNAPLVQRLSQTAAVFSH